LITPVDKGIHAVKNESAIPEPLREVAQARFTLDMYGKIAEIFSLDFTQVPQLS
jgi:hypothetical protein